MIDHDIRAAVLTLSRKGRGMRAIAKALGISRNSVKKVEPEHIGKLSDSGRGDPTDSGQSDRSKNQIFFRVGPAITSAACAGRVKGVESEGFRRRIVSEGAMD